MKYIVSLLTSVFSSYSAVDQGITQYKVLQGAFMSCSKSNDFAKCVSDPKYDAIRIELLNNYRLLAIVSTAYIAFKNILEILV
jgi:hypothetical protein